MPPQRSRTQPLQRPILVVPDHPIEERLLHLHCRAILPLKSFAKPLSVGVHSFRNVAVKVREEATRRLAEQRLVATHQLEGGELMLVFRSAQRSWVYAKEPGQLLLRDRTASSCQAKSVAPQRVRVCNHQSLAQG